MWCWTDPHDDPADRDITDVDTAIGRLLSDIPAQRTTEVPNWIGYPLEALIFEDDSDGFYSYVFWLDGVEIVDPGQVIGLAHIKLIRAGRWGGWTTQITAPAFGDFLTSQTNHAMIAIRRYRLAGPAMSDIELLPEPAP